MGNAALLLLASARTLSVGLEADKAAVIRWPGGDERPSRASFMLSTHRLHAGCITAY
jgi:hypothetical protein